MNGWREECLRRFKQTQKYNDYDKEDLVEELIEKEQELQRKDNNWNELKKYVEDHNDCWDLQPVLDKINELEGDNK